VRSRLSLLVLLALIAVLPAGAAAAPVPEGADWGEATFPSSDGVTLHADILRPKGLASDAETPVILSIGP
jgi:predicted acyl esterase